jgi:hypothetical protein
MRLCGLHREYKGRCGKFLTAEACRYIIVSATDRELYSLVR